MACSLENLMQIFGRSVATNNNPMLLTEAVSKTDDPYARL